ncbi:hypothetical protein [Micromonospora sp. WMMD998]|uniref:hypothetical protein n=1 Tax=Micromonospora sp. WMMD998 TaxID=3016092 RepID=UPI00249C01BF|nr:hypothetical protein [Micromonospora sp. WMMD998]WFE39355.1 hypothetical protein O7619_13365 [Micromonospora sp. WMMD998]
MAASATAVGLRRPAWDCQKAGDGELAVLPADEPENVLIDDFTRELADRLADHNEDRRDEARLRLRLALHHGIVEPAANGYAGAGTVVVSRLVDSAPARAAQAVAPQADLVVVLSNRLFLDTVAQGHTALRPVRFRNVTVRHKEFTEDAWLYVPGFDVHGLVLAPPSGTTDPEPAKTTAAVPDSGPAAVTATGNRHYRADVINEFHGQVSAEVIGIRKDHRRD